MEFKPGTKFELSIGTKGTKGGKVISLDPMNFADGDLKIWPPEPVALDIPITDDDAIATLDKWMAESFRQMIARDELCRRETNAWWQSVALDRMKWTDAEVKAGTRLGIAEAIFEFMTRGLQFEPIPYD